MWIAIIGSIIVVVGQLFGTIFPIWLGPDLSDYNLISDPIYHLILYKIDVNVDGYNITCHAANTNTISVSSTISVASLHRLHNYNREIYLYVEDPPGFESSVSNPVIRTGQTVSLTTNINMSHIIESKHNLLEGKKYPITIQGIGADGKKRNCTIVIDIEWDRRLNDHRVGVDFRNNTLVRQFPIVQ